MQSLISFTKVNGLKTRLKLIFAPTGLFYKFLPAQRPLPQPILKPATPSGI